MGRIGIFDSRSEPHNGVKDDIRVYDKHIAYSIDDQVPHRLV